MKKIIMAMIVILLSFTLTNFVYAEDNWYRELNADIESSGLDKPIHIVLGTAISYSLVEYAEWNRFAAAATPAIIGIIKESTDKNFDIGDALSWVASGILGGLIIPEIQAYYADDTAVVKYTVNF